ncbi:MAG: helix-turn-helix domain-containing protein [Candidatus Nitrosocosmicus sp.]
MKERVEQYSQINFNTPGELIKYTRKKMGYSQKYTAQKTRMTSSGLSKFESGAHFLPRNILEICHFLKIDPKHLMELNARKHKTEEKSSLERFKEQFPDWKEVLKQAIHELR